MILDERDATVHVGLSANTGWAGGRHDGRVDGDSPAAYATERGAIMNINMKTTIKCGELGLANRAQAVSILRHVVQALEEDPEASIEPLFCNLVSIQMWLLEAARVHFDKEKVLASWTNDSVNTSCESAMSAPIKYKLY